MILPYNKDMQKTDISDENENISLRKILSSNIRTLRGKYHLTQERLAENAEISFALGEVDNTHDLTIALQKASTALQYTIAVRDKFLEAYKEIMNMQI